MTRKYKTRSMQVLYDDCMRLAADKSSELYHKDGSQRTGAMHRCAFWDGFNGKPRRVHGSNGTLAGVCYSAGMDFARATKQTRSEAA